MGRYIDEILQPDEKVLFTTTVHWVVYLPAILAWAAAIFFFVLIRGDFTEILNWLWLALAGAAALLALYWSVQAWFRRWTSETDVTNMRVVHKEGFIRRDTFEMSLDRIESVDVSQSIPGRLLGYGDVTVVGVGETDKKIPMIASPIPFRNHITAR
jgi:uncharacterized membrane protein YdbT with pleckstrin-like domain